ncbi:MAG: hypothetical protein HYZ27_10400 [Deltaproteobacteria bacterium]|nr:hypothetical protein [Deltaproteobacteria bacterium]
MGDLLSPATGDVTVEIEAETADWYALSEVELFITQTYVDADGDSQSLSLAPTRTAALAQDEVLRGNGGRARVFSARVTLTSAELGAGDGWLVVRVRGQNSSLYPVTFRDGGASFDVNATTPESFVTFQGGMEPYAFSNPVFIDRNGNGHYDPPYPMRMAE